jgi:hypothetical protein
MTLLGWNVQRPPLWHGFAQIYANVLAPFADFWNLPPRYFNRTMKFLLCNQLQFSRRFIRLFTASR